ncbi:hypothetical protein Fmac_023208 [Flemingia macrophylla]|uniref:Uncharacterized protein n=1 Tax=Flemingia macrophylla TaxID=520843 RepID=A0ABD1LKW5_9FABA
MASRSVSSRDQAMVERDARSVVDDGGVGWKVSSAFDFPSFDRRCKADNDKVPNVQKKIKKNSREAKAMEKAAYAFGERKVYHFGL